MSRSVLDPVMSGQPDARRRARVREVAGPNPEGETPAEWSLFAGSAHPKLGEAVARALGVSLGACRTERFPDGETSVCIEQSVREQLVLIVQPTGPPVNDNLVELMAFADACRRAAARQLIAFVPYYGYARGDRRHGRREPIMASVAAAALEGAGVHQVVTIDIHSAAVEGFFHIPLDNLTALPALARALAPHVTADTVVVSPDLGRAQTAAEYASVLGCSTAVLHKRRTSGATVQAQQLVGDVQDRPCIIIDDMISTGATLVACAGALERAGARNRLIVAATHGVFTGNALADLRAAGFTRIYVTDSLPPPADSILVNVVPCAPLLAAAAQRILTNQSLADLT